MNKSLKKAISLLLALSLATSLLCIPATAASNGKEITLAMSAVDSGMKPMDSVPSGQTFYWKVEVSGNPDTTDTSAQSYKLFIGYNPEKMTVGDKLFPGECEPAPSGNTKFDSSTVWASWASVDGLGKTEGSGFDAKFVVKSEITLFYIPFTAKSELTSSDLSEIVLLDKSAEGEASYIADKDGNDFTIVTPTPGPDTYKITWKNGDTVLGTSEVNAGDVPAYTGETPTKDRTAQYTYTFDGWDPAPVAATGDATYTAKFASTLNKYTIKFVADGTTLSSETYDYGTAASKVVVPEIPAKEGYTAAWDKAVAKVTKNATYTAVYTEVKPDTYTVSFNITGEGTVSADKTSAKAGETVTLTVTPAEGYQLKDGSLSVKQGETDVAMTGTSFTMPAGDVIVSAEFEDGTPAPTYTLTFAPGEGSGTMEAMTNTTGDFTLPACTFTAPEGKVFDKWAAGDKTYAAGEVFKATGDATVTATWKTPDPDPEFNIIVAETTNGSVTVDKTTAKAKDTVTITVKADTDNGYALGVVTVKDSNNRALAVTTVKVNEEYTFVVPSTNAGDITVSANFAKPINITASLSSNGEVTVQKTAVENQTVIINTDPDSGYRVSSVKVTDTASKATIKNTVLKSNSQYSFVVPTGSGDIKVDVVFARSSSTGGGGGGSSTTNTITVTKNTPANGKVTVSSSSPVPGNTVTITVTPDTGYKLDKLTATNTYTNKEITLKDSGKDDGKYTFTAPSNNVRVEASFVKIADVTVTVEPATNGTVKANADKVPAGGTITVTATPNEGYVVDTVTAVDSAGKDLKVEIKEGQYLFTAPDKADTVKVSATFKVDPNYKPNEPAKPVNNGPFVDVASGDWFNDAVMWANEKGITTGTTATTFSPNEICTRAQAVTFLWRLLGQPAASITSTEFTDIDAGAYYYPAVLWAVENNITTGTSGTTFSPSDTVTRGQLATFLYRLAGAPDIAVENPFGDVASNAYYYFAVLWAFDKGIVTGYPDGTFKPANDITRAEIVTMMYRGYSAIH